MLLLQTEFNYFYRLFDGVWLSYREKDSDGALLRRTDRDHHVLIPEPADAARSEASDGPYHRGYRPDALSYDQYNATPWGDRDLRQQTQVHTVL